MTKQKGIIYLENNALYIAFENKQIIACPFQPNTFHDLEVINIVELEKSINVCIAQNKLPTAELILILSPQVLFEKTFNNIPTEEEIQQFIEYVPFEEVSYRQYTMNKSVLLSATNKVLIDALREIFKKAGFTVETAVPLNLISSSAFNQEVVKTALQKIDSLRQYNLLEKVQPLVPTINSQIETKHKNNSILMLSSIFILLLGVLGFMLFKQQTQTAVSTNVTAAILPTVPPPPSTSPTNPSIDIKNLRILITNGSGNLTQGGSIKSELTKLGFTTITVNNVGTINSQQVLVFFSSQISPQIRELVTTELKKTNPNVNVQENNSPAYDIAVTLPKI